MKLSTATSLILALVASTIPARADQLSVDAPLLDQISTRVNDQIFTQQKNGVLTDSQAARLQLRRQSIMQDANNRRNRNKGILPTGDCSRLVKQMESLQSAVSRAQ